MTTLAPILLVTVDNDGVMNCCKIDCVWPRRAGVTQNPIHLRDPWPNRRSLCMLGKAALSPSWQLSVCLSLLLQ